MDLLFQRFILKLPSRLCPLMKQVVEISFLDEGMGDFRCIQRRYLKDMPFLLYGVLDTGDSKLGGHDCDEHVTSYFHIEC